VQQQKRIALAKVFQADTDLSNLNTLSQQGSHAALLEYIDPLANERLPPSALRRDRPASANSPKGQ
jgi:hypothetical protein